MADKISGRALGSAALETQPSRMAAVIRRFLPAINGRLMPSHLPVSRFFFPVELKISKSFLVSRTIWALVRSLFGMRAAEPSQITLDSSTYRPLTTGSLGWLALRPPERRSSIDDPAAPVDNRVTRK